MEAVFAVIFTVAKYLKTIIKRKIAINNC